MSYLLKISVLVSLFFSGACSYSVPAFLLWESAVISSPGKLSSSKTVEFVYSTQPLQVGQVVTTFVPIGQSYRVMCCLKVKDGENLTLKGLEKTYSYDPSFVRRVRAIKGPTYVYFADFLPNELLNKHMKLMVESAGDTNYSAIGVVGQISVDRINGRIFDWEGYGKISLETNDAGKGMWRHKLTTSSTTVVIEEPSLPD